MTKKSRGSAFPKRRHPEYRRWMRAQPCLLADHYIWRRIGLHDRLYVPPNWRPGMPGPDPRLNYWAHVCWGPIDPAHVGEKQSQGAYDVGRIVPLCRASHAFYDEHRSEWRAATGCSEADMESAAAGYALKFVERGGTL